MKVRMAEAADLVRVNELRREVNELHVQGKPEVFKPGFGEELESYIHTIFEAPDRDILVAEDAGLIIGFACLREIVRPETPYMKERRYIEVDEFGVAAAHRRCGAGRAMFEEILRIAKERGFDRIDLNMWEFNEGALKFYESVGLKTYRRYMECTVE